MEFKTGDTVRYRELKVVYFVTKGSFNFATMSFGVRLANDEESLRHCLDCDSRWFDGWPIIMEHLIICKKLLTERL